MEHLLKSTEEVENFLTSFRGCFGLNINFGAMQLAKPVMGLIQESRQKKKKDSEKGQSGAEEPNH